MKYGYFLLFHWHKGHTLFHVTSIMFFKVIFNIAYSVYILKKITYSLFCIPFHRHTNVFQNMLKKCKDFIHKDAQILEKKDYNL